MRDVIEAKRHPYVAGLLAEMLERRKDGPVVGTRPLAKDDPRHISRYIHRVVRPSPTELEEMRQERERHQRQHSRDQQGDVFCVRLTAVEHCYA